MSAIAEGCHDLTSISLSGCYDISDIGISAIAEGCHQLTSTDLSGCGSISDIGISAIAQGCHDLTLIYQWNNCPHEYFNFIQLIVITKGIQLISKSIQC